MSAVSWSLVLIGLVISIVVFVISYKLPDIPEIVIGIMAFLGLILIIVGGVLSYKDMNRKKCKNCRRDIPPDAKVCPYCGNKV